ncbi:luciferin 4-monooxygenase-like isoform X2 [Odontomachus brunneus]|uniref:luciferin 4-monooxygenase-like isoform X2 n=1 Tax=Odontomachus brunneus TaxID=486640 RepID=UPI0013F252B0|nr:luciferin 4-monooxygenase-like isoform X2 [Odontomachus brunneus]
MGKQGKIYGRPRDEPLPNISMGQLLLDKMREHGDRVFLKNADNGSRLTYSELLEKSVKLAKYLQTHGIKSKDRICIVSENQFNWLVPAYASLYIGAICVPYNSAYTEWEFKNVLNISKPRIIFVSKRTEKLFTKLQSSFSWQMEIIELDDESLTPSVRTLTNILNNEKVDFLKYNAVDIGDNSKHPAVILNSSGTTGPPKGVTLSHRNLIAFVIESSKGDFFDITKTTKSLLFLPFYHGYAFGLLLLFLINGGNIILMSNFEFERFLKLIDEYKPTHLPLVPPIMILLVKHPLVERYDFRSVREIICGAAPLAKEIVNAVKSRLGVKNVRNAYGMTEITIVSHISDRQEDDIINLGCLLPGLYNKIVDIETQETLGVDQIGEICFKGEQVMLGYWNNPEATKQTIDKDGWLHSGDLGYYDQRGLAVGGRDGPTVASRGEGGCSLWHTRSAQRGAAYGCDSETAWRYGHRQGHYGICQTDVSRIRCVLSHLDLNARVEHEVA